MSILIITLLLYGDAAASRFIPAVTTAEFSSASNCEAARTAYLAAFKPVADQVNATIAEQVKTGELHGPHGAVVSAICVKK